jgi:hypothetical protein
MAIPGNAGGPVQDRAPDHLDTAAPPPSNVAAALRLQRSCPPALDARDLTPLDRFSWERLILDPKVGMSRDTLLVALILATYSTGATGGDIKVGADRVRQQLGYEGDDRYVRRLIAELRDDYGVIWRVRRGNRHNPSEYALVDPGDLLERAERARSKRAGERIRETKRPRERRSTGRGAPGIEPVDNSPIQGAARPVQRAPWPDGPDLNRAHGDSLPGAHPVSTGRTAPHDQETYGLNQSLLDQDQRTSPYPADVEGAPARDGPPWKIADFDDGGPDARTPEGTQLAAMEAHDALRKWELAHPEARVS